MNRREFLGGSGAMIVAFSLLPRVSRAAGAKELDAWLAIGADGAITAYTGKCDLGQGIATAQVQLVAEELSVAMAKVTLVECDTALTPDQGTTSGSQSTPTNFNTENLALAAATAREALLALAAKRLGTKRLAIDDGVITGGGRKVTYGELVGGKRFELPLDKKAKRKPIAAWKTLGQPLTSIDRVALLTGQFEYVHHVRVPGMLHGRVVRPPQLGATLVSVGKIAGAQVVVKANFIGVVAETQYAAMVAAQRLEVVWKPGPALPPQPTFFDWLRAQPAHDQVNVDGEAMVPTHRATYTFPYQSHGSVGPSCAVADVRGDGATVWSPTQSAFPTRSCIAMLLGVAVDKVRVVFKRGSGCYGLNGADAVSFDAAVLSQAVGKPVRVQYTRADEFASENYGSACAIDHRATLVDGAIAAWDREAWVASLGNRPGGDKPGNVITGMLLGYEPEPLDKKPAKKSKQIDNNSNAIPAYVASAGGTVKRERVVTHTVRSPFLTGPLRSPLRIQNTFANESFVDELAHAAGADPIAFREHHLRDPRVLGVLRAAAKAADWKPGQRRGRGVACVAYEGQNGYAAMVAEVEVDTTTGAIKPRRYVVAIDCGPISNPDGLRNQVEGGLLQGTSRALVEQIAWDASRVTSTDWSTYPSLHLDFELPTIEIVTVVPTGVPATGAGETSITLVPAALANAVFDATGARLRDVPFTPARVLEALRSR